MPFYNKSIIETNKQLICNQPQDKWVTIGSTVQSPIPLDEYKKKYPCSTKWWNTSNQCEDLQQ